MLQPEEIPYTVARSRRKTWAIHITSRGTVEVRVPLRVSDRQAAAFFREHRDWVWTAWERKQQQIKEQERFSVSVGDTLPFLGREYPVCAGEMVAFNGEAFFFPPGEYAQHKPALLALYRALAQQWIPPRVEVLAGQTGLFPQSVRITGAKTRWGSCSGKNRLNFSWRLILAPPAAVDYVIFHELCHIRCHNHSGEFWALVESCFPDYRMARQQLQEVSRQLARRDWDT